MEYEWLIIGNILLEVRDRKFGNNKESSKAVDTGITTEKSGGTHVGIWEIAT